MLDGKEEKERLRKAHRFLKLTKAKFIIFILIIGISVLLQVWDYNQSCLELICKPAIIGVTYYIFWVFDFLQMGLVRIFPPHYPLLILIKIITLGLQLVYWYLITCLIAMPINKIRGKIGAKQRWKRKDEHKKMKIKIERDLRRAQELEKEKLANAAKRI